MKEWMKLWIYWPEALAIMICALVLSWGIDSKEGYHMDELLSFELSNGEFNPWIVPTQPQGRLSKFVEQEIRGSEKGIVTAWFDVIVDVIGKRGESKLLSYTADVYEEPVWISSEQFHRYLTVDEEDDFSYLSVYFNVKDDNHPPLHFMLLHTVSSIFKNRINPWMGCFINLLFVLGILALLMKLGRQCMTITGYPKWGRAAGLCAALLYGLSVGALSTTLLIRMYAMLSFFCVASLTIHLDKLFSSRLGTPDFREHNLLLVLVTIFGFWTQYFFLFYCLILAAVTLVMLLRQKRSREAKAYVRNMVVAALVGVGLFPFAIGDVFSSGRGVEALQNLATGLSGYGERIFSFLGILLENLGGLLVLYLLAGTTLLWWYTRKTMKKSGDGKKLWIVLILPAAGYFLLAARMSPYLVDRYIMPLFPIGMMLLILLPCTYLARLGDQEKCWRIVFTGSMVLLVVLQLIGLARGKNPYLYTQYREQLAVARENQDIPCICVYEGVGYYENLPEFTSYARTLLVTMEELENRKERASVSDLEQVVVVLKNKEQRQELINCMAQYGLKEQAQLWASQSEYGDSVLLFSR